MGAIAPPGPTVKERKKERKKEKKTKEDCTLYEPECTATPSYHGGA
jgi:hypothetical protein